MNSRAESGLPQALTRLEVLRLLEPDFPNPFIRSEEYHRHWAVDYIKTLHRPLLDCPLLRIWDEKSGSQPTDNRMLSRSPKEKLNTEQARKDSLTIHLNHADWRPTPYISFTTSKPALEELATSRINRGRRNQILTVINPIVRLREGLPILSVRAEMDHYGIPDPYNQGSRYYTNHYVCLWEVTEKEIVRHYNWENLLEYEDWYEDVIMPDFRRWSRERPDSVNTHISPFNMSNMQESLPIVSTPIGQASRYSEDSDGSSEQHYHVDRDYETDTDDEVEEANQSDDTID